MLTDTWVKSEPETRMLWDQTTQLPKEQFALVQNVYAGAFSLEVRLQMAGWIEEKFLPQGTLTPAVFDANDPQHQELATAIVTEMVQQLDEKIATMHHDPEKFLTKNKLQESSEALKVSQRAPHF